MTASDANDRSFDFELTLPASADAVWRALTDPVEVRRWFAPSVTVDPRVGGEVTWSWPGCHDWIQSIEVWQAGRHLRTRYHLGGQPDGPPLFIDFHLSGRSGSTTLRVVHSGFGADSSFDQEFDGVSRGWPVELGSLHHYLTHHEGTDRVHAVSYAKTSDAPGTAWARLFGDGAIAVETLGDRPGEPFSITIPGAGKMAGTLLRRNACEWTGAVANLGNAWVRWSADHWGGATTVTMWLALYGPATEEATRWQDAFDGLAARLTGGVEGAAS